MSTSVAGARTANMPKRLRFEHTRERDSVTKRLRSLGLAIFVVQLALIIAWNAFEISRFSETIDFESFYHIWYLIGHGVLNPGPGWWKAQAVFIMWPLALVETVFPQPIALLVIQDVATVLAELVAYFWLIDVLNRRRSLPIRKFAIFGLALLVLNPWIYWSISWDYHTEAVGALFMVLASRAFYNRRWTAWLWSALTILSGMVPATFLLGVAIGLLLERGRRRAGLLLGAAVLVWIFVMFKIGAGTGLIPAASNAAHGSSSPLAAAVSQIGVAMSRVPADLHDMVANLAPTGFIGALASPVIGVVTVVLGTSTLAEGYRSVVPSFQNLAIYLYMPVGTIVVLSYLMRRFGAKVVSVVTALILLSSVTWAVVWLPNLSKHWVLVSDSVANALKAAEQRIPHGADLVVSQGVAGVFGARADIDVLHDPLPSTFQVTGRDVWFLITPYSGTETQTVRMSATIVEYVANRLHAKLISEQDGVWLLEWHRHGGQATLQLPATYRTISAALFQTQGTRNLSGGPAHWSVSVTGKSQLAVYSDYWLETIGKYKASAVVRSRGPFEVTLRNATTDATLSQRTVASTRGYQRIALPGAVTRRDPATSTKPYTGASVFSIRPVPGYPGNELELTVTALGGSRVSVRSVSVKPARESHGIRNSSTP